MIAKIFRVVRGARVVPGRRRLLVCWLWVAVSTASLGATDFGLFGDVTFFDSDEQESTSGFALGNLDFYVLQDIGDRLTGFLELVFEAEEGGEFHSEIERMWIRYSLSEAFHIAAGRFHTPLGYWNRHYHHGTLIQDTVERPFFLDFEETETGVMPVHLIGMMASGDDWVGAGTLRYELVVGNSDSLSSEGGLDPAGPRKGELDPNPFGSKNFEPAFSARLALEGRDKWQLGLSGLTQKISESGLLEDGSLIDANDILVEQTILGADFLLEAGRFGLMGEVFEFDHSFPVVGARSTSATAFYVQAWVDLREKWRLVYRHSALDSDESDLYFRLLRSADQSRDLLTLVYRMSEVSALKLEIEERDVKKPSHLEDATILRAQWAFLVP